MEEDIEHFQETLMLWFLSKSKFNDKKCLTILVTGRIKTIKFTNVTSQAIWKRIPKKS